MNRLAVLNIVGLTQRHIGEHTPRIQKYAQSHRQSIVKPAFPAVTCTAQSDYLTGKLPSEHGIVANGWYNRDYSEIHFWKQSNHLVSQPKLWQKLKEATPSFKTAKLFWWYNMYSSADYTITPRPMYPADGRKVFDVYTQPMGMREEIKADLGDFPFFTFWGPKASIPSSQWIAKSAQWVEEKHSPNLNLVYLPHLDYNLQRLGPSHPDISKDLQEIDTVVGDLIDFFAARNVEVVLLSEYGITDVDTPIHINRALREKGWITIKDELGLEQLDCGASKAFAVADHQVAHVYLNDSSIESQVRDALLALPGVTDVLDRNSQIQAGIAHERSGDLIAIAAENAWFTHYYWLDDALAPDFARCVDIHRKAGYDPVELFVDPNLKLPAAKIAKFLLKKKLGFRALLDVIPLDAKLVKGSHGRLPQNTEDWPIYISPRETPNQLTSPQVHDQLLSLF
ncbi:alkaline phosphatase family protein [Pelagicoccus mobilis]|uniref:Alkaline phosphatase family protein n=1 Tax=Pelagicoccus mobilis TaxID=415221 RepID=A0A934S0B3_9BACT|nr:nucleotide pyrophosphatase/phosphodiesterase family protein [Pelagicoccus mobilis]MBK1880022.1 alkaline phosphatase family protein [Pelagicoccus mobilis]